MKVISIVLAFIAALGMTASAGVLVNEVMVNEPGSSVTLEWIELYNDSTGLADLTFYTLSIGSTSINFNIVMLPAEYVVICRKLVSSGGTPGFEERWGNNSGGWGDSPEESYRVIERSFSLPNQIDSLRLYRTTSLTSQLKWPNAGVDGVSFERVSAQSDIAAPSQDPDGSTPGRLNSVASVANDLTVDTVLVSADSGITHLTVRILNLGTSASGGTPLVLHYYDPVDPTGVGDTIDVLAVDPIPAGDTGEVAVDVQLSGQYQLLGVTLDDDDRPFNNQYLFRAPGEEFPPVIIMEFLANPDSPLETEWVELLNISDETVDLKSWRLGDQIAFRTIATDTLRLAPGDRLILANDTALFRQYYTSFTGRLYQPTQWPSLNNDGDALRLADAFGFEADYFLYSRVYPDNCTWAREEDAGPAGTWGQAADSGGTPGQANVLRNPPASGGSSITIEPRVFSPDGDGLEDQTTIIVQAPTASGYTLKLYDRDGRIVRTFADNATSIAAEYVWNGSSDAGNRLPIGIYICYFEVEGVESVKTTVVIAR